MRSNEADASAWLAVAGAGRGRAAAATTRRATAATRTSAPTAIGEGEGALSILAWPGYAEDGSTDPEYDWVTPFEEETGCKTTVKSSATPPTRCSSSSRPASTTSSRHPATPASGSIDAGIVAPVNTSLLTNYADLSPFLKDADVEHRRRARSTAFRTAGAPTYLMYNNDVVTPAPDSWGVVFDKASPYKGKVTAYDSPIYIADAALYLKSTQPDLGITDPYALTRSSSTPPSSC